jgi:hypothetical protein
VSPHYNGAAHLRLLVLLHQGLRLGHQGVQLLPRVRRLGLGLRQLSDELRPFALHLGRAVCANENGRTNTPVMGGDSRHDRARGGGTGGTGARQPCLAPPPPHRPTHTKAVRLTLVRPHKGLRSRKLRRHHDPNAIHHLEATVRRSPGISRCGAGCLPWPAAPRWRQCTVPAAQSRAPSGPVTATPEPRSPTALFFLRSVRVRACTGQGKRDELRKER